MMPLAVREIAHGFRCALGAARLRYWSDRYERFARVACGECSNCVLLPCYARNIEAR